MYTMAAEFCTDDGSCVVRELPHASSDAVLQRVADVIGDAFEYDAWFKKDGEPRRLAGGAALGDGGNPNPNPNPNPSPNANPNPNPSQASPRGTVVAPRSRTAAPTRRW